MPSDVSINQIAETVSQKMSASARDAMGVVGGLMSTATNGAASMFNAFSSSVSKLGLSPQSLNAAVSQVTNALDATSSFKGPPESPSEVTQARPEETHESQSFSPLPLKFPLDIGKHYIELRFVSFSQRSIIGRVAMVDPLIIQLPMSANLQENYSIGYGTSTIGVLGSVGEAVVNKYFENKDKGLAGGNNTLRENATTMLGSAIDVVTSDVGKEAAAAVGAKAALAVTGGVGAALQKQLGATLNPNIAVLFEKVGFRQHQFSFKLYPTSAKESAELRNIIKEIRNRIIPKQLDSQFLGFPDKVDIQIYPANPYVDKLRTCVVTSMSVNYAPNGVAFFKGGEGNPVAVELTLAFQETEIIYKDLRIKK